MAIGSPPITWDLQHKWLKAGCTLYSGITLKASAAEHYNHYFIVTFVRHTKLIIMLSAYSRTVLTRNSTSFKPC
ncbi:hypothetical protein SFRURICE_007974 [Spodoptera frugiperda]|nr:hypothetical protein SFRURICE_007974 [Spodoptera frugiperda]